MLVSGICRFLRPVRTPMAGLSRNGNRQHRYHVLCGASFLHLGFLTAYMLAKAFHAPFENLAISSDVTLNLGGSARVILLAVLCAFVSILFCKTMHVIKALYARFFPNPFVRAFTGGVIIILLSLLLRTDDYLGPGMNIIERALHGETAAFAFLLKILFTALTIGAGFKGGEMCPRSLPVQHSAVCLPF